MERISRRAQIYSWGDSDYAAKLRWCVAIKLSRQLKDEVAAHRVAEQGNGLEAIQVDEMAHHDKDITRETRVVEGRGKGFGAAAVAHIHADDVAATLPELV